MNFDGEWCQEHILLYLDEINKCQPMDQKNRKENIQLEKQKTESILHLKNPDNVFSLYLPLGIYKENPIRIVERGKPFKVVIMHK